MWQLLILPLERFKTKEANTMDPPNRETYSYAKIERRDTDSWMTICVSPDGKRSGITQEEWKEYVSSKWPDWEVACVWNKTKH